MIKFLLSAAFVGVIVAANYTTSHYGMVPVGFGLITTSGTYFAGISFILRDSIQDRVGRAFVIILIVAGAALSAILSPGLAVASGVAFMVSELADLAVYSPLRRRGYIRAAIASNMVGAFVDTVLFLALAGFPVWPAVPGQMIAKLAVTAVAVAVVGVTRALLRQPEHA